MDGFFTRKQTESKSRPDGKVYSCASCGLSTDVNTPKMEPFGDFKKGIMNIGEAPGEVEDKAGKPWQGKTGKLLQQTYRQLGIDLFEDCININAVLCHPVDAKGQNRTPTNDEVVACRRIIFQWIDQYQPKVIVVLGGVALQSILGHRWKKNLGGITKWRGWMIPDQDLKCWIAPVYHPSFVSRGEKEVSVIWENDLTQALSYYQIPWERSKKPKIETITDLSPLGEIKFGIVAFDYETTGLKPQGKGHRIVCASVADSRDHCYVFMMPKTRKERQPFIDLLTNTNVTKMAHNIKFEQNWSVNRLKTSIKWWEWDSMLAAHILDNRTGITGLKFQTYVNFGVIDYSSEIEPYLKSGDNGGNSFNKIEELLQKPGGEEMLLEYCALDSIYEYRLAMRQQELMGYEYLPF